MKYALALTVTLATAAALHEPAESPPREEAPARVALSEPVRQRVVHYGMGIRELTGLPDSHAVDFITQRTGAPREQVVDRLRKIKGRTERDPDSLVEERVGLVVAIADGPRVDAAIVSGLCKPFVDEGDAVALAACQSRQAGSMAHRLCRVSNGAFVGLGARMALTSWRVVDVRAELLALAPAPNMVIVRNDDGQAAWEAALAGNVPPLRSCNEGE
jgi:hypothetical protein